ncbi:MAG: hypothetical protein MN733_27510 [Nitrososphaera sp.]|nr:hypothetical protein [Nitrososphaera sp.]
MSNKRLTGWNAIRNKERDDSVVLCKYSDPVKPSKENITVKEAREIAKEDPTLIYGYVAWLHGNPNP